MPPFGLYSIPKHHLSAGSARVHMFNTADYPGSPSPPASNLANPSESQDMSTPTPAPTHNRDSTSEKKKKNVRKEKTEEQDSGNLDEKKVKKVKKSKSREKIDSHENTSKEDKVKRLQMDNGPGEDDRKKIKREKKERREKQDKKDKKEGSAKHADNTSDTSHMTSKALPEKDASPVTPTQPTKRGPGRPRKSDALLSNADAVLGRSKTDKSVDKNGAHTSRSSGKKRKRRSTIPQTHLGNPELNEGRLDNSAIGGEMLDELAAAMGNIGADYLDIQMSSAKGSPTKQLISNKEKGQNNTNATDTTRVKKKRSRGKIEERQSGSGETEERKKRKMSSSKDASAIPQTLLSSPLKHQIEKKSKRKGTKLADFDAEIQKALETGPPDEVNTPSSSANPDALVLPPLPAGTNLGVVRDSQQKRIREALCQDDLQDDKVLVPETPPASSPLKARNVLKVLPIPPPKLLATTPRNSFRKTLMPKSSLHESGPKSSQGAMQTPASAPVGPSKTQRPPITMFLTPKNLERVTQPLSDEPKPKLKRQSSIMSAFSTMTTSTVSTAKDSLSKSGAGETETQPEAELGPFNTTFLTVQKAVNFTEEMRYLNSYLDWHAKNDSPDPMPCLGQATGCTTKKEQILRLGREENINISALVDKDTNSSPFALTEANTCATKAELFLTMAIRARVPVPIGPLNGIWTLYCPKYAEHHFDRYGYGERTLTISSISGFKDKNSYTGRLNIPPRPMNYSVLTFASPPHASFRTTTIKTASEGYEMDVIFMGNGYLHLRMDLSLLLKGKPTEVVDGKKMWMEFIGVHEQAVKWGGEMDPVAANEVALGMVELSSSDEGD